MLSNNNFDEYSKVPDKEYFKDSDKKIPQVFGYGVRHIQLVIFLLCLSVSFIARGHLGISVVAMTNTSPAIPNVEETEQLKGNINFTHESPHLVNGTTANIHENKEVIKYENQDMIENKPNVKRKINGNHILLEEQYKTEGFWNVFRTYNWPKPIQEMILGSFFLGYCVMMFPIGMVCQRWGGKVPLQISLFVNGVVSILTPWLAMWGGWKAVCFCRIMQGLSQAGTYPGIQTLLAKWVPSNELATLTSYVYTGSTIGSVIAFQLGGLLADSRWGWPSTFWVIGLLCITAFTFLTIFGAATPSDHSSISDGEKNFILGHINDGVVKIQVTPWKAILTSKPVWASFAAHVGSSVAFFFFFMQMPSYIHYVLGINVKSSGLLTSFPYIVSFFTSITFGLVSDFCTNRNIVSVKNARRISNSISQVGIAVSLILASFATSAVTAIICFVIGMGCYMGIHTGWMVNHIDLAPNYSGTIMSIGNIFMNFFVLLLPVLVSQIVIDVRNQYQWRIMFSLVAGLALVCNFIFVVLMSSETQTWNYYKEESTPDDNNDGGDEKK